MHFLFDKKDITTKLKRCMCATVFLIRSYGTPNGAGRCFWPSSVIRLGPHWRNSKITLANFVHAVLDADT